MRNKTIQIAVTLRNLEEEKGRQVADAVRYLEEEEKYNDRYLRIIATAGCRSVFIAVVSQHQIIRIQYQN